MSLLIKFLLAHLIGDFLLQPNTWVLDKQKEKYKSKSLYKHLGIHAIVLSLVVQEHFLAIIIITILHGVIDLWKLYFTTPKNRFNYFLADQFLHIYVLVIIADSCDPYIIELSNAISTNQIILFVTCLLLATQASAIIIKEYLSKWNKTIHEYQKDVDAFQAGKSIGILERTFVFFLITTHNYTLIGFLIGAKSVFRFGDLQEAKNRQLTEYVLIGTLLSFGLATIAGILYLTLRDYVS